MKRLLIVNGVVMALCWVSFILLTISTTDKFRRKHPGVPLQKVFWADLFLKIIKFELGAICPIVNIYIAHLLLSKCDEIQDEIIQELESELAMREKEE